MCCRAPLSPQRVPGAVAAGDGGGAGAPGDLHRGAGARGGAVPQLAGPVVAPGQDGAVAAQRVPAAVAGGDGGGAGEPGDLHRGAGVRGGAVPQLAVVVVAQAQTVPSPRSAYPARAPPATAVTPVSPATCTGVLESVVVPFPAGRSSCSPGPDGAVAAQRVPGESAAGDGGGTGEPGDLHRGAGVRGAVVAPGQDGAVAAGQEVAGDVGDQVGAARTAVVEVDLAVGPDRGDDQVGHGLAGAEVDACPTTAPRPGTRTRPPSPERRPGNSRRRQRPGGWSHRSRCRGRPCRWPRPGRRPGWARSGRG